MRTRVMKIIAVCEATMNTHKTILLYDPIARTQSDHRFPYPNNHHKRDLGLYLKFGFNSTGGVTSIRNLNGDDTFRLRRILNK